MNSILDREVLESASRPGHGVSTKRRSVLASIFRQ